TSTEGPTRGATGAPRSARDGRAPDGAPSLARCNARARKASASSSPEFDWRWSMPTSADGVWPAVALGAVSYAGLLAGAVMGSLTRTPHRRIAAAMSVGAGLLLAGASLRVAADAIRLAGLVPAAPSLLLGAAACAPPAAATRTSL